MKRDSSRPGFRAAFKQDFSAALPPDVRRRLSPAVPVALTFGLCPDTYEGTTTQTQKSDLKGVAPDASAHLTAGQSHRLTSDGKADFYIAFRHLDSKRFLAVLVTLLILCVPSVAQPANPTSAQVPDGKEIAITIDDLPLNGPRFELARLQTMTDRLLAGIQSHRVPVVGFVNESQVYVPGETDARIAILKSWFEKGVELGNHTFAHVGFRDTPLAEYEDDFVRGETITRSIMKSRDRRPRFFRHPFLQMGPTKEQEQSFEAFIGARGYRIAPITIDIMDWMFRVAYVNARTRNDMASMKEIVTEYLRFTEAKIDFSERVAADLFGRPIKHILLMHANELNADNFDRLIKVFTDRGYRFISLDEALQDNVYQFPDRYRPTSDWLNHWSFSKEKKFDAPQPPEFIRKAYEDGSKPSGSGQQSVSSIHRVSTIRVSGCDQEAVLAPQRFVLDPSADADGTDSCASLR